jgi:hypothetical protein
MTEPSREILSGQAEIDPASDLLRRRTAGPATGFGCLSSDAQGAHSVAHSPHFGFTEQQSTDSTGLTILDPAISVPFSSIHDEGCV